MGQDRDKHGPPARQGRRHSQGAAAAAVEPRGRGPPQRANEAPRGAPGKEHVFRTKPRPEAARHARQPPQRGNKAVASPREFEWLLEEGGSHDEEEAPASLLAWTCYSGVLGFALALAVAGCAAVLAVRTGRLHLKLQSPAEGLLPIQPDTVLGEALSPACSATQLPASSFAGNTDGSTRLSEVLESSDCCQRCQGNADCKVWTWASEGDTAGCWLHTQEVVEAWGAKRSIGEGSAVPTDDGDDRREQRAEEGDAGGHVETARKGDDATSTEAHQETHEAEDSEEAGLSETEVTEDVDQNEEPPKGQAPAAVPAPTPRPTPEPTSRPAPPAPTPRPPPPVPAWHSPWSRMPAPAPEPKSTPAHTSAPKPAPPQPKDDSPAPVPDEECEVDKHLPEMWNHKGGEKASFKVLTYNLFWWNLFGERKGDGDKASHLIEEASKSKPFDLMGFQECEDVSRVLQPVGLMDKYYVFSGKGKTEAICIAARKKSFELMSHGIQVVGEDTKDQYFGKRAAQWMRLSHRETGQKVFFMNHHGPLPVNSGGVCGGRATALKLLRIVVEEAEEGDAVIMVGDFNAGDGSTTVRYLEKSLHRIFHGDADGGIDNFFSNVNPKLVTKTENLGSGGSDHDALSVELQVGGTTPAPLPSDKGDEKKAVATEPEPRTKSTSTPLPTPTSDADDRPAECGIIDEGGIQYTDLDGEEMESVNTPSECCLSCSASSTCRSWTWAMQNGIGTCWLWTDLPNQRRNKDGFISGLPKAPVKVAFKRL